MRKLGVLLMLIVTLAVTLADPVTAWADRRHGFGHHGHRHHHHRFHRHVHGFRSHIFLGIGPSVVYPYYYYPPSYYVYTPPPVVVQEAPVYVQQQPAPSAPAQPEAYWYYCAKTRGYYPDVQTCEEPWIKVPPRTQ